MHVPIETEIKLLATPAMLDRLGAHPGLTGPEHKARHVNGYYDTLGGALGRAGVALRLRTDADRAEQTLKFAAAPGSPVSRAEWTVAAAGDRLDLALFPAAARDRLDLLREGLAVACFARTVVDRATRRIERGSALIEAAFDRGTIYSGGREGPIAELELELIRGQPADLFALALELPLGPELQWSLAGKAARARAVAFDLPAAPTRASQIAVSPDATFAQGLRTICWHGLAQLVACHPLVLASGDPEAVHQTRVAIRRLRAALALLKAEPDGRVFAAQFKALASALAPPRDLHLLHEYAAHAAAGRVGQDLSELVARLAAARDEALEAAQRLMEGEALQRLLLRFALWLEADDGLAATQRAARSFRRVAAHALTRRLNSVTGPGKLVPALSDHKRHKLRIAAKSLRYTAEFYPQDGVRSPGRRRFGKALQRLQDHLGTLNDLALVSHPPATLFGSCDPLTRARLAAELKVLGSGSRKVRRQLLDRAGSALAALDHCKPWWTERGG